MAWLVLAEAGDGGGAAPTQGMPFMQQLLFMWLPIGLIFYFLLLHPQRKEQARREAMISAVKPNDRVLTVGGFYGVVTNVHRDAKTVVLRIDESNNTKVRVTLSSIAQVVSEEPAEESPPSS